MSGFPWVPEEDDMLLHEVEELKHDMRKVAFRLNSTFGHLRTQRAVRGRLLTLRTGPVSYIIPGGSGSPWSQADVDKLLDVASKERDIGEVARAFPGRTRKAIVTKLCELRARPKSVPPPCSVERRCLRCRVMFRSPDRRRRWLCDSCGLRAEDEGPSMGV